MDVNEALERVESRYHPIAPEAALAAEVRRLRAEFSDWSARDEEVVQLGRERDAVRAAVERVRALHRSADWGSKYCAECIGPHEEDVPLPCPTLRALDGEDER